MSRYLLVATIIVQLYFSSAISETMEAQFLIKENSIVANNLNQENFMVYNLNQVREADEIACEPCHLGLTIDDCQFSNVPIQTGWDKVFSSQYGFPCPEQIVAFALESLQRAEMSNFNFETQSSLRGQVRDAHGNLSRYSIGPESNSSEVRVEYVDPASENPVIKRLQIKRPNNQELISFERERSDPNDANSPFTYTMSRDGARGDLQFGSFGVGQDGRINLYFDAAQRKVALSFNPETGEEEYPRK